MRIANHDIGLCSWSVRKAPLREVFGVLRELGLSHLQLGLAPLLRLDEARLEEELEQLRSADVSLTAGMINFGGEDYSSIAGIRKTGGFVPDEFWPEREKLTLAAGKLARKIGLDLLTTHAGFIPPSNHADYPEVLKRVEDLAKALAESGVKLALETGQEPASELLQFINDLPAPRVGVNFDPANMMLYGSDEPIAAMRTLGRHICHVHVKDAIASSRPGLDWGQEVKIGTGQVRWDEFLTTLGEIGYAGPLVIERETRVGDLEGLRGALETLRRAAARKETARV